ncbi:collagen alpha-6(VI) chain-like [Actinia tenebrosa]|uniref:Collagen alpha-6(VI) chain-like n=1 Tax=Actinia tenebrosa TaxID=6105 RepID=A0A6P8J0L1_ACTTE|nr:collagen alpha-6(VI) chain-like [Actinia tenebrosa]
MITYGDRSQTAFTFPIELKPGARYDKEMVNRLVDVASRSTGQGRNINQALGDAVQLFTNRLYGARTNSRKEVIIITHGAWPSSRTAQAPVWYAAAANLRKIASIYGIGVRPQAREFQLNKATQNIENNFMVDTSAGLGNIWRRVVWRMVYWRKQIRPLDIAFAVDSSSDITEPNWRLMLSFVKGIIQGINTISPERTGTRIAYITYSSNAATYKAFNAFQGEQLNQQNVMGAIDRMPRQPGTIRQIERVLDLANNEVFTTAAGARPSSLRYLVLLLAGAQTTNVPASYLRDAAKRLYDKKIYVYGIGAGPSFNQLDVLRTAARGDFVYFNYKYDQLPKLSAPIAAALPKGHGRYLDLGLLVDSSDAVNWNAMLSFVKSIVRSFEISVHGTHVGFISFASTANLAFDFATNPAPTADLIVSQINGVAPQRGNQRRIDIALNMAAADLFIQRRGQRPTARQVILVITAGRWSSASQAAWQAAANALRQRKIEIYPIGVGASVERPQLAIVASKLGFVFTPASYAALRSEREPVIRTIVYGARKEETKPLDVGFVVDSSSDISGANWNHILNFLLAMVDGIDNVSPAPSGTRFGLISFSTSPQVFFKFNTLAGSRLNIGEVKKRVRNTPRQAGAVRRFDRALQSADQELFSTAGGHRTNAQKILIVIMAGQQLFGQKKALKTTVLNMQKRGFRIYTVGAGARYDQQETIDVASFADFVYYNKYPQLTAKIAPKLSKDVVKGRGAFMDIGFVVDGSKNVNWKAMQSFTQSIAKRFDISQVGTHIGYITYSDAASIAFPLNALQGKENTFEGVSKLIANTKHLGGTGRRLGQALGIAFRDLFSKKFGVRAGSRRILVIFTTGAWATEWKTAIQQFKSAGIDVFVFGIGNSVKIPQLEGVATKPSYVFTTANYEKLPDLEANLIRTIIYGAKITPLDIALAVDSSPDISAQNWGFITTYVRDLINAVGNISSDAGGTRFGMISYSAQPNVVFRFNTLQGNNLNAQKVTALAAKAPRQPGTPRRIDIALQSVGTELFSAKGGTRPKARKILIIIFAGPQDQAQAAALQPAYTALRKNGVIIYTVGVGRMFLQPEVLWTASHADYVYYRYKWNRLADRAAPMAKHLNRGHGAYLDLGFIVDSSSTVNWQQMLAFVKYIVGSFDISQRGTHVGFIAFGDTASVAFKFDALSGASYTVNGVNNLVDGVNQLGGSGRRIDLALQAALQNMFTVAGGSRVDARKVLVILTTGQWQNQYEASWKQTVSQMRTQKFELYSLGVGQGISSSQLEDVASEPGYVFTPDSYTTLNGMYKRLVQVIVFGAPVRPLDIGIAVDSSQDITAQNWNYILTYIREFIGSFSNISPAFEDTRFALISYANQPKVYFTFKSVPDNQISAAGYQQLVSRMPRQTGNARRIDSAIQLARTDLFSLAGGARLNSRRVFVILFAGPQAAGRYPKPSDASAQLQKNGVRVYTVGVGRRFLQPQVLWTASHADYVYYRYNYAQLPQISEPQGKAVAQGRGAYLDIAFVIDSSNSVNWQQMQKYSQSIVNSFDVSQTGTHFAYITYSSKANIDFGFNALSGSGYTPKGVNRLIDGITHKQGTFRYVNSGLEMAERQLFTAQYGARQTARQVIIVITTGQWPNRFAQSWRTSAANLKRRNFDMYVIGIGSTFAVPQLQEVASQSGYMFTYSNYQTFATGYREVVQVIIFGREACYNNNCANTRPYSTCKEVNGKATCVCAESCPSTPKQVCGSDGKTYTNDCEMKRAACQNNKNITVKSPGPCDPCAGFKCSKPYSTCENQNGKAVCACSKVPCPRSGQPFCASDGKTYNSQCDMRKAACESNTNIRSVKRGQCDCKVIADVAFLVDSSGSVGRRNWVRLLAFVSTIISKLNVGPTATHIALVRYSTQAEVDFTFRSISGSRVTPATYNQIVKNLRWQRGFTFIDRALITADQQVFTAAAGMRRNVPKMAFVITDGTQTRDRDAITPLATASARLKAKGIRVYAMGIGTRVSNKELNDVATSPKYVYRASDFKQLVRGVDTVVRSICEGKR